MIPRPPASLPHVVVDRGSPRAEGPAWHALENRLYWADASAGTLHCFDPASGSAQPVPLEGPIHRFVVQADGGLLLLTREGSIRTWRGGDPGAVCGAAPWGPRARIDAAACCPEGRVYCSVRQADGRAGSLFRIDLDGSVEKVSRAGACGGGLAFSPDGRLMYAADGREISAFQRDPASGALSDPRVIARLPESLGVPRGLALDAKGFLWVPFWGGSCVLRLSPAGKEDLRVYFTARLLSGLAFGGSDRRDLYVTSSGGDNRRENGPAAGAIFRHRPGARGAPEMLSRVGPR